MLISSIKLPLKPVKDSNGKFKLVASGSLLFSQLFNLRQKNLLKAIWIGMCGYKCENAAEREELTKLYEEHDCIPVFVSDKLYQEYVRYYENVMKPLFYSFKGLYDDYGTTNKYDDWGCFKLVNEKFSDKIIEVKDRYEEEYSNVFIWLNNHQLFLVPQYLRKKIKDCNIGIYIHSPFPSSDLFRMFPYCNMILKSILECDCIGFHVFEQAKHFMICCEDVLGITAEMTKHGHYIVKYTNESAMKVSIIYLFV